MYAYVNVYVCVFVCIRVCVCVCLYVRVCARAYMHTYVRMCVHTYTNSCMHIGIYILTETCLYTHAHTHTHIQTHAHTHTQYIRPLKLPKPPRRPLNLLAVDPEQDPFLMPSQQLAADPRRDSPGHRGRVSSRFRV